MTQRQFELYIKVMTVIAIVGALFIAIAMNKSSENLNPLAPIEEGIEYDSSFMPDYEPAMQYVELYVDDMKFGEVFWVMRDWNREFFYWRGKKYHTMTIEEVKADAISK